MTLLAIFKHPAGHARGVIKAVCGLLLVLSFPLSFMTVAQPVAEETVKIHFGLFNFPPQASIEDGEVKGSWVDFLTLLTNETNMQAELNLYPAKRLALLLFNGEVNAALVVAKHIAILPDLVTYNQSPWFALETGVATVHRPKPETLEDIANHRIGIIRGFSYNQIRDKLSALSDNLQLIEAKDHTQLLRMLSGKRIDYALVYHNPMQLAAREIYVEKEIKYTPLSVAQFHLVMNKSMPNYGHHLEQLEAAYLHLYHSGQLDECCAHMLPTPDQLPTAEDYGHKKAHLP